MFLTIKSSQSYIWREKNGKKCVGKSFWSNWKDSTKLKFPFVVWLWKKKTQKKSSCFFYIRWVLNYKYIFNDIDTIFFCEIFCFVWLSFSRLIGCWFWFYFVGLVMQIRRVTSVFHSFRLYFFHYIFCFFHFDFHKIIIEIENI